MHRIRASVFRGICVAGVITLGPSIIGAPPIPQVMTPVGAMQVIVAFVLGVTMACHSYIHHTTLLDKS